VAFAVKIALMTVKITKHTAHMKLVTLPVRTARQLAIMKVMAITTMPTTKKRTIPKVMLAKTAAPQIV
jgi:hypothetical protein